MRGNFRVWDNKNKRYDYGDFFITTDGELLKDVGSYSVEVWRCEYNEPGRYIAEFYTGIKDVNGDEICDGDIIRTAKGIIQVITWVNRYSAFVAEIPNGDKPYQIDSSDEIIGNIHENPELLENS